MIVHSLLKTKKYMIASSQTKQPIAQPQIFLVNNQVVFINTPDTCLEIIDQDQQQLVCRVDFAESKNENSTNFSLINLNQLANSDFADGTKHWLDENQKISVDFGPNWTLEDGHTAYIYQPDREPDKTYKLVYQNHQEQELIPIFANYTYQISGYFALHRCQGLLQLELFDKQNKIIDKITISLTENPAFPGGKELKNYLFVKENFSTKTNCWAKLTIIKEPTLTGQKDSFFFFTKLFLGIVQPESTINWRKMSFSPEVMQSFYNFLLKGKRDFNVIKLPTYLADGKAHNLQIVNSKTGESLLKSPLIYQQVITIEGAIEGLENSSLIGWAQNTTEKIEVNLNLIIDGQLTDSSIANLSHPQGKCGFRFPIPQPYLDGRIHYFQIEDVDTGLLVAQTFEITPFILTPWDAIQKYSKPPFPSYLSPIASDRYRNLDLSIQAFAQGKNPEKIKILAQLHQQLVRGFERKILSYNPLSFPVVENPQVSVIIPIHNKFAVTYNCLNSLLFAYNDCTFEVIIVDDGSEDDSLEIPELIKGITYLRHETAQGFILSCNLGAKSAKGEYLVFLNNDTEVTVKWLDEMLFVFANFPDVGLVGSKLVYPDGKLQEAGGIVWKTGDPWNYGRGQNANHPKYNYTRQVDYVSGASLMIPQSLWTEINGFSVELCPAYFEDTDLAFKVKATGKKVVYTPFSQVYHYEGISSGTSVTSGMKRYQEVNRPKFKRKWVNLYQYNGEVGEQVDLAKDRGIRYRALFLDLQPPRPDQDAGSYAAIQEMRLLQSLGFKATFIPENMAYLGSYTEDLQRLGIEVIYAPFYYSIQEFLKERGQEFDVVYITRYQTVKNHITTVRQYAPQAKVMFCNADLHFLRELRSGIANKNQEQINNAIKVRELELEMIRQVDVTLSYNSIEHAVVLSHNLEKTNVVTCPWVVDIANDIPSFESRQDLAFLGGFGHPPNLEAMTFFIQSVMPLLREKLPKVRLLIYGSNIPEKLEKMATDDVVIKGYV